MNYQNTPKRSRIGILFTAVTVILVLAAAAVMLLNHYGILDQLLGDTPTESIPETTVTIPTTQATTVATESPTTEPTTEPTTAPTEPFVVSTASVGVTGDVLMHSPVYNAYRTGNDTFDFTDVFRYIGGYYEQYDLMVANMEGTLSGAAAGYSGYPKFNCPDGIAVGLKNAGVDMLLYANNHTYDRAHSGFIRTQEVIRNAGLQVLGIRESEDLPFYTIQDINGIRVGMVCYTYATENTPDGCKTLNGNPVSKADGPLIATFQYNNLDAFYGEMEQTLAAMYEDGAEATMLYIHWGDEYRREQNAVQQEMAQTLCELGVDVIVGGHPHVIQPFEMLTSATGHKTYCIYSLGNALSNQRRQDMRLARQGHTEDSMIFSVTFEKWNDGSVNVCDVNILPIWVSKEWNGKNVYYILPLDISLESWDIYNIGSKSYAELFESYRRTMEIVGPGLNACREAMGLAPVPLTFPA